MFLKFGSEENIKDLFMNGTIYMNSREYFRKMEDRQLRGDSYEGVYEIRNYGPGEAYVPSLDLRFPYRNIHVPFSFKEVWGNIYCLYSITPETVPELFDFKMDDRISGFGTHCLIIKDPDRFIVDMSTKFRFLNYRYYFGLVDYYNAHAFNGKPSVFSKPDIFSYQKEFRFYVERNSLTPLKLQIDTLKEYSQIITMDEALCIQIAPMPDSKIKS
jgi:hypothetical protein